MTDCRLERSTADPPVWLDVFGPKARESGDRLISSLAREGIDCVPLGPSDSPPPGPGLLLFGAHSPELAERVRERSRGGEERLLAVSMRSGSPSRQECWALLEAGASDLFRWHEVADPASAVAARLERWRAVDALVASPLVADNLVGRSPAWRSLLREVVEVGRFSDSSVLVTGETGTGKELVARLIHTLDGRKDKRELVILDCTTVVEELSGSEFFGHEKGAFTGAVAARDGAFALADGGTLFLDEVGELPRRRQAELLRVVQEGTYKRVGSNAWRETRFRLVCATHRELDDEMAEGRFRRDFYYRIADCTLRLPPLRERLEDVPLLARHFLQEVFGDDAPALDPAVLDLLVRRDYPGNVRDLRRLVLGIARRHVGRGAITVGEVPREERPREADAGPAAQGNGFAGAARLALARGLELKEISNAAADAAVEIALDEERDQQRAADRLGVSRRAVQARLANLRKRRETPAAAGSSARPRPPS